MANLSDVNSAIVAILSQTIYPNGTSQPSIAGIPIRIYEGWPNPQQLDTDLVSGIGNISIYPLATERSTTRYPQDWQTVSIASTSVIATIAGQTITLSGSVQAGQNVAVIVNNQAFSYAVQSSDTLTSIATALTALISASIAGVSNAGAVITCSASARIKAARVGATGTSMRELKRQERAFQVTAWANTPDNRNLLANAIELALSSRNFVSLTDGSAARIVYKSSPLSDSAEKQNLYRRDFIYSIEFATTQTATDAQILAIQENVSIQPDGATVVTASIQINT